MTRLSDRICTKRDIKVAFPGAPSMPFQLRLPRFFARKYTCLSEESVTSHVLSDNQRETKRFNPLNGASAHGQCVLIHAFEDARGACGARGATSPVKRVG